MTKLRSTRAYTFLEVLVVVGIIGLFSGLGYLAYKNVQQATAKAKMTQDADKLNSALRLYQVNGGSLADVTSAPEVLAKLKTLAANGAKILSGAKGDFVDPRLQLVLSEAGDSGPFIVWDPNSQVFRVDEDATEGIKEITYDDNAVANSVQEQRRTAFDQAQDDNWVQDYITGDDNTRTGPNRVKASGGTPITSTGTGSATKLNAPTFSPAPPIGVLNSFPAAISITPTSTSEFNLVWKNSEEPDSAYRLYTGPIQAEPGRSLNAKLLAIDLETYVDSDVSEAAYVANEQLAVVLSVPSKVNYITLGGAMQAPLVTGNPVLGSLNLSAESVADIPPYYENSSAFQVYYTKDGSSPASSPTAVAGPAFTNPFPGVPIHLSFADFSSSSQLMVTAIAKTLKPFALQDSALVQQLVEVEMLTLPKPIVSPTGGTRKAGTLVSLAPDFTGSSIPAGARIYYTTNGMDPGNSNGNPTDPSAVEYLGTPFPVTPTETEPMTVIARVYPPSTAIRWFNTSQAESVRYELPPLALKPTFSPVPPVDELNRYPVEVTITNPNDSALTEIHYRLSTWPSGDPNQTYVGPFTVEPGTTVTAFAKALNEDQFRDSAEVDAVYSPLPVTPIFTDNLPSSYNYFQLGGPLMPGSPDVLPVSPGSVSLQNGAEIPLIYQNDDHFRIHWTLDTTNPLTSAAAIAGADFTGGYPGDSIPVTLADFSATYSATVNYASKATNPALFTDSSVVTKTISIAKIIIAPPSVFPPGASVVPGTQVTLDYDEASGTVPAGARIFYRLDGIDPGDDAGNPLAGATEYTGTPITVNIPTLLRARVYPPASEAHWFTPSDPAAETYTINGAPFFAITGTNATIYSLDPLTGANKPVLPNAPFSLGGLAYSNSERRIFYLEQTVAGTSQLGRMDLVSSTHTVVGNIGMAGPYTPSSNPQNFAWYGNALYYITPNTSDLVRITLDAAQSAIVSQQKVKDLGAVMQNPGDLAISDEGMLFWTSVNGAVTNLYRMDLIAFSDPVPMGTLTTTSAALGFHRGQLYGGGASSSITRLEFGNNSATISDWKASAPVLTFTDYAGPALDTPPTTSGDLWALEEDNGRLVRFVNYRNLGGSAASVAYGTTHILTDTPNPGSLTAIGGPSSRFESLYVTADGWAYSVLNQPLSVKWAGSATATSFKRPLVKLNVREMQQGEPVVFTVVGDLSAIIESTTGTTISGTSSYQVTGISVASDGAMLLAYDGPGNSVLFRVASETTNAAGSLQDVTRVGNMQGTISGTAYTISEVDDIAVLQSGAVVAYDSPTQRLFTVDPLTANLTGIYSTASGSVDYEGLTANVVGDGSLVFSDASSGSILERTLSATTETNLFSYGSLWGYSDIEGVSFEGRPFGVVPPASQNLIYGAIGRSPIIFALDPQTGQNGAISINAPFPIQSVAYNAANGTIYYLEDASSSASEWRLGSFNVASGTHSVITNIRSGYAYVPAALPRNLAFYKDSLYYISPGTDDVARIKISPAGAVESIEKVGDALQNAGAFANPGDIVSDPYGVLYWTNADGATNTCHRYDPSYGGNYRQIGTTQPRFNESLAFSRNLLYGSPVADPSVYRVTVNSGSMLKVSNLNPSRKFVDYGSAITPAPPLFSGPSSTLYAVADRGEPNLLSFQNYKNAAGSPVSAFDWGTITWRHGNATGTFPNGSKIEALAVSSSGMGLFVYNDTLTMGALTASRMLFEMNIAALRPGQAIVAVPRGDFGPTMLTVKGAALGAEDVISGLASGPDNALYAIYRRGGAAVVDTLVKLNSSSANTTMQLNDVAVVGSITGVGESAEDASDLAIGASGLMYVSDNADDKVYLVNSATGAIQSVYSTYPGTTFEALAVTQDEGDVVASSTFATLAQEAVKVVAGTSTSTSYFNYQTLFEFQNIKAWAFPGHEIKEPVREGVLWGVIGTSGAIYSIDPQTGATSLETTAPFNVQAVAANRTVEKIFYLENTISPDNWRVGMYDRLSQVHSLVGNVKTAGFTYLTTYLPRNLEFYDGDLYFISPTTDDLVRIDLTPDYSRIANVQRIANLSSNTRSFDEPGDLAVTPDGLFLFNQGLEIFAYNAVAPAGLVTVGTPTRDYSGLTYFEGNFYGSTAGDTKFMRLDITNASQLAEVVTSPGQQFTDLAAPITNFSPLPTDTLWALAEDTSEGRIVEFRNYNNPVLVYAVDRGRLLYNDGSATPVPFPGPDTKIESFTVTAEGHAYFVRNEAMTIAGQTHNRPLFRAILSGPPTTPIVAQFLGDLDNAMTLLKLGALNNNDVIQGVGMGTDEILYFGYRTDGDSFADKLFRLAHLTKDSSGNLTGWLAVGTMQGGGEACTALGDLDFSPDGRIYAHDAADQKIYMINRANGAILSTHSTQTGASFSGMAIHPNSLIMAGADSTSDRIMGIASGAENDIEWYNYLSRFGYSDVPGISFAARSYTPSTALTSDFYACTGGNKTIYRLDPTNGSYYVLVDDCPFNIAALACDGANNVIYYLEDGPTTWRLGRYDTVSGIHTVLGDLKSGQSYVPASYPGNLAFFNGFVLYLAPGTDDLVRVQINATQTGIDRVAKLADLTANASAFVSPGDLALDSTGKLFWVAGASPRLYCFDLKTMSGYADLGGATRAFPAMDFKESLLWGMGSDGAQIAEINTANGNATNGAATTPALTFVDFAGSTPNIALPVTPSIYSLVDMGQSSTDTFANYQWDPSSTNGSSATPDYENMDFTYNATTGVLSGSVTLDRGSLTFPNPADAVIMGGNPNWQTLTMVLTDGSTSNYTSSPPTNAIIFMDYSTGTPRLSAYTHSFNPATGVTTPTTILNSNQTYGSLSVADNGNLRTFRFNMNMNPILSFSPSNNWKGGVPGGNIGVSLRSWASPSLAYNSDGAVTSFAPGWLPSGNTANTGVYDIATVPTSNAKGANWHLVEIENYRAASAKLKNLGPVAFPLNSSEYTKFPGGTQFGALAVSIIGEGYFVANRKLPVGGKIAERALFRIPVLGQSGYVQRDAVYLGDLGPLLQRAAGVPVTSQDLVTGLGISPDGNLCGVLQYGNATAADYFFKLHTLLPDSYGNMSAGVVYPAMSGSGVAATNAQDMTFGPGGTLYVSDVADQHVYTVNPATGLISATHSNESTTGRAFNGMAYVTANGDVVGAPTSGPASGHFVAIASGDNNDSLLINYSTLLNMPVTDTIGYPVNSANNLDQAVTEDFFGVTGTDLNLYRVNPSNGRNQELTVTAPYTMASLAYDHANELLYYLENASSTAGVAWRVGKYNITSGVHTASLGNIRTGWTYNPAQRPNSLVYYGNGLYYIAPGTDDLVRVELSADGTSLEAQFKIRDLTSNVSTFASPGDLTIDPAGMLFWTENLSGNKMFQFNIKDNNGYAVVGSVARLQPGLARYNNTMYGAGANGIKVDQIGISGSTVTVTTVGDTSPNRTFTDFASQTDAAYPSTNIYAVGANYTTNNHLGIYRINTATGITQQIANASHVTTGYLKTLAYNANGNKLYYTDWPDAGGNCRLYRYDITANSHFNYGQITNLTTFPTSITQRPWNLTCINGSLYLIHKDSDDLIRIRLTDTEITDIRKVADINNNVSLGEVDDLTLKSDGFLYFSSTVNTNVWKYNMAPLLGGAVALSATGPNYKAISFDPRGRLIGNLIAGQDQLQDISQTNGAATYQASTSSPQGSISVFDFATTEPSITIPNSEDLWAIAENGTARLVRFMNYRTQPSVRDYGDIRYAGAGGALTSITADSQIDCFVATNDGFGYFVRNANTNVNGVVHGRPLFRVNLNTVSASTTSVTAEFIGDLDAALASMKGSAVDPASANDIVSAIAVGTDGAFYMVYQTQGSTTVDKLFRLFNTTTNASGNLLLWAQVGNITGGGRNATHTTAIEFDAAGQLYVYDSQDYEVLRVNSSTAVITSLHSTENPSNIRDLAINPGDGDFLTSNFSFKKIERVNASGTDVQVFAYNASPPWGTPIFSDIPGISFLTRPYVPSTPPVGEPMYFAGDLSGPVATGRGLVRTTETGTIDPSFATNGGINAGSQIRALVVNTDGTLYAGGNFNSFGSETRTGLVKVNANGSVVTAFNPIITSALAPTTTFSLNWADWMGFGQHDALNGTDTNTAARDAFFGLASASGGISGFKSQTFSNVGGSGVNMTLHYSQNMSNAAGGSSVGPALHGATGSQLAGANPDRRITGANAMRLTGDTNGTITPTTVVASFSEPVYYDQMLLGSLSQGNSGSETLGPNLLYNSSFEIADSQYGWGGGPNWFPDSTHLLKKPARVGLTTWGYIHQWGADRYDWIEDATRAQDGSKFIYLDMNHPSWPCVGNGVTIGSSTNSSTTMQAGKSYKITYKVAAFNKANPLGGGNMKAQPQMEFSYADPANANTSWLNINPLDAATGASLGALTASNWTALQWKTAYAYFTCPTVNSSNPNATFYITINGDAEPTVSAADLTNWMGNFNVICFGNLSTNSILNGKVWVGGTMTGTSAFQVGNDHFPTSADNTWVVCGPSGTGSALGVNTNGAITFNGNSNSNLYLKASGARGTRTITFAGGGNASGRTKYDSTLPTKNTSLKTLMQSRSTAYRDFASNSVVTSPTASSRRFLCNPSQINGTTGVAVFTLSNTDVFTNAGITSVEIASITGNDADVQSVIINVPGTTMTWSNSSVFAGSFTSAAWRQKVIWNFHAATGTLAFGSREMSGAVLAPNATVTSASTFNGAVVCNALTTTGAYAKLPYTGPVVSPVFTSRTGLLIDDIKIQLHTPPSTGAFENTLARSFGTSDATGTPIQADTYTNLSGNATPVLGTTADPTTVADAANVRVDPTTTDFVYHTIGVGKEADNKHGRVSVGYTTRAVRSTAVTTWASRETEVVSTVTLPTFTGPLTNDLATSNIAFNGFRKAHGPAGQVHAIAVQADGKVIIGGEFAYVNGTAKANLARLNTNGTLDTTFPTSGGVNGPVYSLKVQTDGRVVVGGNFTNCNGLARNHIARINSNGSQDSSFTSPLASGSSSVYWIDQQVDAKLIVGGNISAEGGLVRLNTNGTKDATFATGAGFGTGIVHEGIIFNDNSLFVVGDFTTYKGAAANRVAKLTNTGTLNSTFNPGSGFNAETLSLAMSFSGHLYSSGGFSSFNGEARNKAAFVNATDGALDTSYVPDPDMSATKIWRIRRVP